MDKDVGLIFAIRRYYVTTEMSQQSKAVMQYLHHGGSYLRIYVLISIATLIT